MIYNLLKHVGLQHVSRYILTNPQQHLFGHYPPDLRVGILAQYSGLIE